MASLFVNGPAHIFLGLPVSVLGIVTSTRVITYLGTTEGTPDVQIAPRYEAVHNDMAGSEPMDESYQGRSAHIACRFTRWVESTYAAAVRSSPGGVRGFDSALDLGALMVTEGYAIPLYMVAPFALKAAYAAGGMPMGFRFPAAVLDREHLPSGGTKPKKIALNWHCLRILATTAKPGLAPNAGSVNMPGLAANSSASGTPTAIGLLSYGFLLYDEILSLNGFSIN